MTIGCFARCALFDSNVVIPWCNPLIFDFVSVLVGICNSVNALCGLPCPTVTAADSERGDGQVSW